MFLCTASMRGRNWTELDNPEPRAPTSRMVILVAYSFTALACNTSGG